MSAKPARLELRWRHELPGFPVDIAWSPDAQRLVAGCGEGDLHLIRCGANPGIDALPTQGGGVLSLAWQGAGMLFASSAQDGSVRLWDARDPSAREIHRAGQWVEQLAFSTNGKLLAAACGRDVLLFDAEGSLRATLADHPGTLGAIAWRPRSGELAAVGNGGLRLHRVESQVHSVEHAWAGACLTASWSPDGRVLASGMQDGSVHFWRIAAGNQSQMRGYSGKVTQTSWSANSRYLATAAAETLVIWDFSGGGPEDSRPLQLQGHSARVTALAFRPSGAHLASAGRDWRLMLWRPGSADQAEDAHLLGGEIVLLRWSRDGRYLAVADRHGTLSVFEFLL
ncbi:MAG: hypothetical protein QM718_11270 [Steroidobacteraceae bacterium]